MAEITLQNLSKDYKEVKALRSVDLTIRDKEFLVILGPSGCGKTTILRLISGIEKPSEGAVLFDGEDMDGIDPMHRNVAMVFQNYGLYPHLNVFKNIAFPLETKKMKKDEIRKIVEETAAELDISHILNRKPRELSGGQKQRVALARAMVRHPSVFLFDEPLSNLDPKMRLEIRDLIANLHQKLDTTFVYVTHDQSEAMQLADRIVVMSQGSIRQIGTPKEIYDDPNSVYVAQFVGAPQINFFASRLYDREDGPAVTVMGKEISVPVDKLAKEEYEDRSGRKVISAIRPEDFRIAPKENVKNPAFYDTIIRKVVPMGAGIHIEAEYESIVFTAVLQNHTDVAPGSTVRLYVDPACIRLFDGETEASILSDPASGINPEGRS